MNQFHTQVKIRFKYPSRVSVKRSLTSVALPLQGIIDWSVTITNNMSEGALYFHWFLCISACPRCGVDQSRYSWQLCKYLLHNHCTLSNCNAKWWLVLRFIQGLNTVLDELCMYYSVSCPCGWQHQELQSSYFNIKNFKLILLQLHVFWRCKLDPLQII